MAQIDFEPLEAPKGRIDFEPIDFEPERGDFTPPEGIPPLAPPPRLREPGEETIGPDTRTPWQQFRESPAGHKLFGSTEIERENRPEPEVGVSDILLSPVGMPFGPGPETALGKAIMGLFTADYARKMPETYRAAKAAYDRGDWHELRNIAVEAGFGGAMTGIGLAHMLPGRRAPNAPGQAESPPEGQRVPEPPTTPPAPSEAATPIDFEPVPEQPIPPEQLPQTMTELLDALASGKHIARPEVRPEVPGQVESASPANPFEAAQETPAALGKIGSGEDVIQFESPDAKIGMPLSDAGRDYKISGESTITVNGKSRRVVTATAEAPPQSTAGPGSPAERPTAPAAEPAEPTVDVSPILSAKTLSEVYRVGGEMMRLGKTSEELATVQEAIKRRARAIEQAPLIANAKVREIGIDPPPRMFEDPQEWADLRQDVYDKDPALAKWIEDNVFPGKDFTEAPEPKPTPLTPSEEAEMQRALLETEMNRGNVEATISLGEHRKEQNFQKWFNENAPSLNPGWNDARRAGYKGDLETYAREWRNPKTRQKLINLVESSRTETGLPVDEPQETGQVPQSESPTETGEVQGREQALAAPGRESTVGREPVAPVEPLPTGERPPGELPGPGPAETPKELTPAERVELNELRISLERRGRLPKLTERRFNELEAKEAGRDYTGPTEQELEAQIEAEGRRELAESKQPSQTSVSIPRQPQVAERYRRMAATMDAQIEEKRRPMTQNPTPKRNREYRSRLHDADNMERVQKGLLALADAHESGSLPPELAGVKTKGDIYTLVRKGVLGGGYYDVIPDPEYADKSPKAKAMQRLIEREAPEQASARKAREKAQEINRLEESVRFSDIPGFFPTPKPLAEEMVRKADIRTGQKVLEPSAGKGDLADAIREQHPEADITTVEPMHTLQQILKAKGYEVAGGDFMEHEGKYDRIVMNPPFEKGQDAEHIRRAYDQLKPGGKLVALASEGTFFKTDKKSVAFREWLDSVNGTSEQVEPGTFAGKEAFRRTGVASRIVEIERPLSKTEHPTAQSLGVPGLKPKIGPRGGEAGMLLNPREILPDRLRDALDDLPDRARLTFKWSLDQRDKFVNAIKRSAPRDLVSASKDFADNKATIVSKQAANTILHELNRAFGVAPNKVRDARNAMRESALTFVIEAGGQRAELGRMRDALMQANAEGVNRIWKRRALRTIDFAEQHWDKLQPVAEMYGQITDWENAFENANGIRTLYRQGGYVFHLQDIDTSFGSPSTGSATEHGGAPAPFRHIRDYPTYADAIAGGMSPESLNAVDLLQKRIALGQRVANYGAWMDRLRDMIDPITKQPLTADPEVRTRADGSQDVTAPPGYSLVDFGGRQVALHNGYTGLFGGLTKQSWMQSTEFHKAVMQGVGLAKHTMLLFDSYHMGRLAFWNAVTRVGMPTYQRGFTLLDNTPGEIRKMAARGEIPQKWADNLLESKAILDRGLKAGLNVGNVGDNLYTDFLQKIPGPGTFNKWLFEKYQRGAMAEVYLIEHARQSKMFPNDTPAQLDRRVVKDVNTRFGNLQSQGWIKSRTGQDMARILFLAPQWNESLIRAEMGALKQTMRAPADSWKAGRPVLGGMARAVGTGALAIFIGNQLINMATRGHPTWENQEETPGAKISAWIPDYIGGGPGFFLNPMSVPLEMSHLVMKGIERRGEFGLQAGETQKQRAERVATMSADTLADVVRSRLGPLGKFANTFITGQDVMGRDVGRLHAFEQASPLPISGGAVYRGAKQLATGRHEEKYPGEFQKQIMQSGGIKTEQAPDPNRRIFDLAKDFQRSKHIPVSSYHEIPFYGELTAAVKRGNMKDAEDALDKILTLAKGSGEPHTLADVARYYSQYPGRAFTANKHLEAQFYQTLSAAQKQVYQKAIEDRRAVAQKVGQMIQERSQVNFQPQ